MLFKPTSQTLPLSILQETAELVVPVPSFAQTTNQQPAAWLFGNGFKINSKVGGSPTEGWSKRGQGRQVEIDEIYYTVFKLVNLFSLFCPHSSPIQWHQQGNMLWCFFHEDDKKESKSRLVYTESIWTDKLMIKCFETIKDLDPMKRRITVNLTNFEKWSRMTFTLRHQANFF